MVHQSNERSLCGHKLAASYFNIVISFHCLPAQPLPKNSMCLFLEPFAELAGEREEQEDRVSLGNSTG